ncbi:MAG TPA: beta-L-arabinofuranosidase domain-containing protein, partial [Bacteroidales bacterium]|nr:beta-L-arabinofuranosidase domain-containing protein [Bacteroidales bacterium]
NGLISGIGADGCSFYYTNPLESDGRFERAGWFDCSCCPGNVARFMPAMKQYIWSASDQGVNVNLFIGSVAKLKTGAGEVELKQTTGLPWKGDVTINVDPAVNNNVFRLSIRIPAWTGDAPMAGGLYRYITPAKEKPELMVNGKKLAITEQNGFAVIDRSWSRGDVVTLSLPMEPRFMVARDEVKADSGRVAIGAGPLVYCVEEADNGKISDLKVDPATGVVSGFDTTIMSGIGKLTFKAEKADGSEKEIMAVPYYSWANRGKGEMQVWINSKK